MSGTVLFLDGTRGCFVIYEHFVDGSFYVYRQRKSLMTRVRVKRGESVDWIECE